MSASSRFCGGPAGSVVGKPPPFYAFEHLVKRLLEEMNYDDVEVTTRSNDGGVDVVADIELGIRC